MPHTYRSTRINKSVDRGYELSHFRGESRDTLVLDLCLAPIALHWDLKALGPRHMGATPLKGWLSPVAKAAQSLAVADTRERYTTHTSASPVMTPTK
jgi:hypothetical protein